MFRRNWVHRIQRKIKCIFSEQSSPGQIFAPVKPAKQLCCDTLPQC